MIEERSQDFLSKRQRGITIELDRTERATVTNLLPVMPRTKHEKHLVVVCILRLNRLVHRDVAVDVFLIPEAVYEHHRNFQRFLREDFVYRLFAPVSVVTRMCE